MAGNDEMIDMETLELIKNNQFSEGVNFPEETHNLIHDFYEGFDLDKQDEEYRKSYILSFIEQHEAFIINFVTNVYRANINTGDKLSDEITFCKFLDTLASCLTKYDEQED